MELGMIGLGRMGTNSCAGSYGPATSASFTTSSRKLCKLGTTSLETLRTR